MDFNISRLPEIGKLADQLDETMRPCPLCKKDDYKIKYRTEGFRVARCRACGFVYLLNPPEISEAQESYDEYFTKIAASSYAADSTDGNLRQQWLINQQRLNWLRLIKPRGRLLDIGCGRGYFLHHARNFGYEAAGIEISPLAAKYAREELGLSVRTGDIQKPGLLDSQSTYDLITLWHVLEHIQDPLPILIETRKRLTPGGVLIVEVPNLHSLKFLLSPASHRWVGGNHPRYHCSFFTRSTLEALLANANLIMKKSLLTYSQFTKSNFKFLLKRTLKQFNIDSFITVTAKAGEVGNR